MNFIEPRLIDPSVWELVKRGMDGFDVDDEYDRFRRRQRIHRIHLVGYVVSAVLILIGMLLFWH